MYVCLVLDPIIINMRMATMKRIPLLLLLLLLCGFARAHAQGKFSGLMFGDYFSNISRDTSFNRGNLPASAVNGRKDLQGFQFRRIYFTYDYDIAADFTTRFRLEADQAALTSNGKVGVFVKDAYLKWKNVFKGSDLIFGIQPTPAYDYSEAFWKYRALEKTIMDLRGIVPSRLMGLALKGKIDEGGVFNYWVAIANVEGVSVPIGADPQIDKFKRYYANILLIPVKNLSISLSGDYYARPDITDPYANGKVGNSGTTFSLFAGYQEPGSFRIGAEGVMSSYANGYNDAAAKNLASLASLGLSFFGEWEFNPEWSAIARYDVYDPNTNSDAKGDSRGYLIAGIAYKPDKNVSIIPNLLMESYETKPANGSQPEVSYSSSVTGRLTFYFTF